jgi:two-component system nitrate/nitrite response regulator NarL
MHRGSSRVRVYIADDHPILREGLARALKGDPRLELVGAAEGRVALSEIQDLEPDVAVLDVMMPDIDGLAVLNAIRRQGLSTRVLFLSGYPEPGVVYRAVALGASAFLSKEAGPDTLRDAVVAVSRGETVVPQELQNGLLRQIQLREHEERPALSHRELQVLGLTAEGRTAVAIGHELHLSPTTVRTHLQRLYGKLGVSDRAAAVAEGMRLRLLE